MHTREGIGPLRRYAEAAGACVLVTAAAMPIAERLDPTNVAMLYLLAVAAVAVRSGRGPAVFAAVLGVGGFDFFFVPPRFTFAVGDAQYLVTFAVMLAVALVISGLTGGLAQHARASAARERDMRALYALASRLSAVLRAQDVEREVAEFLAQGFGARARLLLAGADESLVDVSGARPDPTRPESIAAGVVLSGGRAHASSQPADDGLVHLLLPLRGAVRVRGVLDVGASPDAAERVEHGRSLLEAVATLAATALERQHFVEIARATEVEIAAERLRASILSALSHDVRTPLTALYGLADTLAAGHPPLPPAARETAAAIRDQALRLSRMVANLLDLARLRSGRVMLRREWQPIEEVIGAGINLLGAALRDHRVEVDVPEDFPLLAFDAVLMERVVCNLLENAARFAPAGTPIRIQARMDAGQAVIEVCDQGPGFAPDRVAHIFEPFGREAPAAGAGTGVGLAICRAILDAHDAEIQAFAGPGGRVRIVLPAGSPPPVHAEDEACQGIPA
ncbi:MAG: DUF4118 domain-containing protein [Gammaproteobacteria bacterium]